MPPIISLSPADLRQVKAAQQHGVPIVRRRASSLLLLHRGYSVAATAIEVGLKSRTTIYQWVRRWKRSGVTGLLPQSRSGRPPTANIAHCQILEAILVESPAMYGYTSPGWTVSDLRSTLCTLGGIALSDRQLRRTLHRLGYAYRLVRIQSIGTGLLSAPNRPLSAITLPGGINRPFRTWIKVK